MAKIYSQEVGPEIILDTKIDLSSATKVAIKAYQPDGTLVELDGTVTDTTKVKHVKTANTLNVRGLWRLHSYAEFSDGEKQYWGDQYDLWIY